MILPKVIWYTLGKLAHWDMRPGMYVNTLLLGSLALAMILGAKRNRGRVAYADAFFPLMILNLGQCESLLWSLMISHVLPICLTAALLLVIVLKGIPQTVWGAVLVSVGLVLLSLSGGEGMLFGLVFALWFGGVEAWAWFRNRHRQPNLKTWIMLAGAGITLVLSGFYFVGYQKPQYIPSSPGLAQTLRTTLQIVCVSFGIGQAELWWPYVGYAVAALVGISLATLAWLWWHRPSDRARVLGMSLFLSANVAFIVAVGWGRAGYGGTVGFQARYALLLAPTLFCVYFVWEKRPVPAIGELVPVGLLVVACITFLSNAHTGLAVAKDHLRKMQDFEKDVLAGMPASALAEKHFGLIDFNPNQVSAYIPLMRRARIGVFRNSPDKVLGETPAAEAGAPITPGASSAPISFYLAGVQDGLVSGWAWDKDRPNEVVKVDIFDGDTLLGTVPADVFDQSFRDAGIGDGRHGFVYPLPGRIRDGETHVIAAKISGTNTHLINSPQTVVLKPP
jgi:hypothetical protein